MAVASNVQPGCLVTINILQSWPIPKKDIGKNIGVVVARCLIPNSRGLPKFGTTIYCIQSLEVVGHITIVWDDDHHIDVSLLKDDLFDGWIE